MASSSGINELGWVDCKGGGQIEVVGNTAYVGHTVGPEATTIVDVADPKNPKVVNIVQCKHQGVHAHKVRVANDLMVTNYESISYAGEPSEGFRGGLNIFDTSDPQNPKHIHHWKTEGAGVHRFTFDGRYAYISPTAEGYTGHICMILDLENPEKPEEVGRWWWPGQWTAGGEEPEIQASRIRCHHPIRRGDRLYVSYWLAGWAILDISDMSKPKTVALNKKGSTFPCPSHTCVPMPFDLHGMDMVLVADEDVARSADAGPAFLWMVNIDDEENPMPIASYQADGVESGNPAPQMTGCHQPVEVVRTTEIPVAWFSNGLRVVDVANPHAPKEVAHFLPDPPEGNERVLSNDVFQDDRGIIYVIDRDRGLHLVERA